MIAAVLALGATVAFLLWDHHRDREAWRRERSQLLDRIKPETAPPPDGDPPVSLRAVPFDDDGAYWASRGVSEVA